MLDYESQIFGVKYKGWRVKVSKQSIFIFESKNTFDVTFIFNWTMGTIEIAGIIADNNNMRFEDVVKAFAEIKPKKDNFEIKREIKVSSKWHQNPQKEMHLWKLLNM